MQIPFNLPHVFYNGSDRVQNGFVLRALLDCLIQIDESYLRTHSVPSLYRSGVRYGRTQLWEPIPALYKRKFGDCKSLTAALIAEYRLAGIPCEPVFRFSPTKPDGSTDYHILVRTNEGYEDPSKVLGMGEDENARFHYQAQFNQL